MLRILAVLVVILVLAVGGLSLIPGVTVTQLPETLRVAAGLGAKLACSARWVTGLDEPQILEDIASYSPALTQLSVSLDEAERFSEASLLGLYRTRAQYRDNIGCTLERGDTSALNDIELSSLTEPEAPWPAGSQVETQVPEIQQALEKLLAADNEEGLNTRALVLVRDGSIIAEAYGEGFAPDTMLLGWSMGKSVTAMLLGHLEYQGMLDVTESAVFEPWQQDKRGNISVEQLLQMSSGLEFNETYVPGSDSTRMLFVEPSASDYAMQSPLAHPPGSHFSYSSGTANLLARLFADKVGADWLSYVQQRVYEPLALTRFHLEPDPSGVFVGSSYVFGSARDWARLGQVMIAGGELNGYRLVSEDWVKRASSPNGSDNDPRYGYQFWLNGGGEQLRWSNLPVDAYAMTGNRGQVVMMIPSLQMVIVRLGWTSTRYNTNKKFARIISLSES